MAPWGGVERLVGNNPLAVGMPTLADPTFLLDMSFSAVARGKLAVAEREGEGLPEGWALDASGEPTTDPTVGLDGLLVPIGGAKGVGLSLISGILSSLLSDALYGSELGALETGPIPGRDGQFVIALNVEAFGDGGKFRGRLTGLLDTLRSSQPTKTAWSERQAERAQEAERESDRIGVPIAAELVAELRRLAAELGVDDSSLA